MDRHCLHVNTDPDPDWHQNTNSDPDRHQTMPIDNTVPKTILYIPLDWDPDQLQKVRNPDDWHGIGSLFTWRKGRQCPWTGLSSLFVRLVALHNNFSLQMHGLKGKRSYSNGRIHCYQYSRSGTGSGSCFQENGKK